MKQFSQVLGYRNDYTSSAGYCAITAMRVEDRRSSMEFDMFDEHVSIKRSEGNFMANVDLSKLSAEEKLQVQMGYGLKNKKSMGGSKGEAALPGDSPQLQK